MLFKLRDYIAKEKRVALSQLARFFEADTTALEPMLDVWVKQGLIVKEVQNVSCRAACLECGKQSAIYYQHVR